jgi:glucosamine-6-phosphate deaminase
MIEQHNFHIINQTLMHYNPLSKVENAFARISGIESTSTLTPYIITEDFPKLGLLTSLRFLEWVSENPEGVISLPTGKTPEYFIKYTHFLLENWGKPETKIFLEKYGLAGLAKPDLSGLHFVQIDEFYPISPLQHNSFFNYVSEYYIKGFGLDPAKALLINSDEIELCQGKAYSEIFPDYIIDLSLRYREAKSEEEELKKASIFRIDQWCSEYEQKIREKGGIGFFLGGIGPDGHIAFNTRGSDLYSTTRLTQTNFETQAVAAGDLGGIEISRNRLVITIGLGSITYNTDAVAIIFAAGEAKAEIVKASLENEMDTVYPATVLQRLKNARFYLTSGAACRLNDAVERFYKTGEWTHAKTERAIIDLCTKLNKYGHHLTLEDLENDPWCKLIPGLDLSAVESVVESVKLKIGKGIERDENQVIYHTGPHHDDIMLGIMPYTNRQMRSLTNDVHYAVMTSGFTAVTNHFLISVLDDTLAMMERDEIQMIFYPDFFREGYIYKWDKDVYHFLDNVARHNDYEKRRGLCHRLVRSAVEIWKVADRFELKKVLNQINRLLRESYDGSKNPPEIQTLKGMLREFEEELVWAYYGVQVKNVHHLRLGFYKGEIFTENPEKDRDMLPILEQLRSIKPGIISLALDPEGSGPDTHYKVLQAIAGAVKEWSRETDLSNLRILGYRNVWYKFHPAEADMIVPVSLNSLAVLEKSFAESYMSQVNASFPSFEYDGPFSALTRKTWVKQLKQIQLLLGKNYFYENEKALLRATHGLVYIREMNVEQFVAIADELKKLSEGTPV